MREERAIIARGWGGGIRVPGQCRMLPLVASGTLTRFRGLTFFCPFESPLIKKQRASETLNVIFNLLAGEEGFEPPHDGTKTRCLTTWLLPNVVYRRIAKMGKNVNITNANSPITKFLYPQIPTDRNHTANYTDHNRNQYLQSKHRPEIGCEICKHIKIIALKQRINVR